MRFKPLIDFLKLQIFEAVERSSVPAEDYGPSSSEAEEESHQKITDNESDNESWTSGEHENINPDQLASSQKSVHVGK